MEIQTVDPELFAALQFIKKCLAGFFQCFRFRMAEVNQIAVVGQDLPVAVAVFLQLALKAAMTFSGRGQLSTGADFW